MRRIKLKTVLELKYKILDTELTKSSPGPSKAGSFKCGKSQCKTCKIIVECQNFTSQATNSPVNILKDPPQIATEGFSMVLRPEEFFE